jgi:hypothetical protein
MALELKYGTITQSNDSIILRVTDETGEYDSSLNPGGWVNELSAPVSGQPKVSNLNGTTISLFLDVEYTNSAEDVVVYDTINLYTTFGPFASKDELIFDIDASMLLVGSTPQGANDEKLLDGWYKLTYSFVDTTTTYVDDAELTELFVDGIIRTKVYTSVKDVIYANEFERFNIDFKEWKNILYPQYYYSMFVGMLAEVSLARKTEVLSMLATLERILNQVEV